MSTEGEARPAARLTVLAGPSGTGRESVVELVRARSPAVWTPVPATTRPPRAGERPGTDRLFCDPVEFDRMAAAGELLEWSRIGPYARGTPAAQVRARLAAGEAVLLPLDLPGAIGVRAVLPGTRLVLLVPPGFQPAPATLAETDAVVVHDLTERAVTELVGLLGSSLPAPARSPLSGRVT
ncbi:guanylate kinase [Micromonospora echinaurantiaca]|uniref:guanylate kinase n=1 Tax=Micromonospora echinaurantiaca TaxID=47857 RepID=UPI003720740D